MSGASRYAWHGVPKVLRGSCPAWMEDWPLESKGTSADADLETEAVRGGTDGGGDAHQRYEEWKGWMRGKRINLNVRQMF